MLIAALVASRAGSTISGMSTSGDATSDKSIRNRAEISSEIYGDAFDSWYAKEKKRKMEWLRYLGENGPSKETDTGFNSKARFHPLLDLTARNASDQDSLAGSLFPFWLFSGIDGFAERNKLTSWQMEQRYSDHKADNVLWLPNCGASVASYLRDLDSPSWKYTHPYFDWECGGASNQTQTDKTNSTTDSLAFGFDVYVYDAKKKTISPDQCPNSAKPDDADMERRRRSYEAAVYSSIERQIRKEYVQRYGKRAKEMLQQEKLQRNVSLLINEIYNTTLNLESKVRRKSNSSVHDLPASAIAANMKVRQAMLKHREKQRQRRKDEEEQNIKNKNKRVSRPQQGVITGR